MIDELRTFVLFAEEGSVQKVARRLPLTQPAVSRQIQRLEQALGATLLDRRQKPPALTPAGAEVVARARDILDAYRSLKSFAVAPEPEGVFRLGLVNGLSHGSLAASLCAAVAAFPGVSLRLRSGWSADLAEQHRLGTLDAAIVLSDGARFHDAQVIGEERLVAIGQRGVAGSADRREQRWIVSPEPCDARRRLAGRLAQQGRPLIVAAEIEDAGLQLALVGQGLGFGLLPRRLLASVSARTIEEVGALGADLCLDVLMLRSPHLRAMAKVADAIAKQLGDFVAGKAI